MDEEKRKSAAEQALQHVRDAADKWVTVLSTAVTFACVGDAFDFCLQKRRKP